MQENCARCGRKVRSEENWLRAHWWGSTAVFHWVCFIALMKQHGERRAEQAAWNGSVAEEAPHDGADGNHGFGR
jgi:hypothetical protein